MAVFLLAFVLLTSVEASEHFKCDGTNAAESIATSLECVGRFIMCDTDCFVDCFGSDHSQSSCGTTDPGCCNSYIQCPTDGWCEIDCSHSCENLVINARKSARVTIKNCTDISCANLTVDCPDNDDVNSCILQSAMSDSQLRPLTNLNVFIDHHRGLDLRGYNGLVFGDIHCFNSRDSCSMRPSNASYCSTSPFNLCDVDDEDSDSSESEVAMELDSNQYVPEDVDSIASFDESSASASASDDDDKSDDEDDEDDDTFAITDPPLSFNQTVVTPNVVDETHIKEVSFYYVVSHSIGDPFYIQAIAVLGLVVVTAIICTIVFLQCYNQSILKELDDIHSSTSKRATNALKLSRVASSSQTLPRQQLRRVSSYVSHVLQQQQTLDTVTSEDEVRDVNHGYVQVETRSLPVPCQRRRPSFTAHDLQAPSVIDNIDELFADHAIFLSEKESQHIWPHTLDTDASTLPLMADDSFFL